MLVFGLIANALVRPLADRWFIKESGGDPAPGPQAVTTPAGPAPGLVVAPPSFDARAALGWLAVGIPVLWGVWVTLAQAIALFS